ncbi:uncharacterized protein LOC112048375 [Bicyclus anynana]|uniref:Uncharacterized protein LOC112048375 n=1 Tax=Bicyclus anynana TaxID=110368 RepID=A0A6J1N996_BICAN|nr:uncharacterized protein LOC112048375 [Bicyclus anynana]
MKPSEDTARPPQRRYRQTTTMAKPVIYKRQNTQIAINVKCDYDDVYFTRTPPWFHINVEMPGFKAEDIDVKVAPPHVIITACKKDPRDDAILECKWMRRRDVQLSKFMWRRVRLCRSKLVWTGLLIISLKMDKKDLGYLKKCMKKMHGALEQIQIRYGFREPEIGTLVRLGKTVLVEVEHDPKPKKVVIKDAYRGRRHSHPPDYTPPPWGFENKKSDEVDQDIKSKPGDTENEILLQPKTLQADLEAVSQEVETKPLPFEPVGIWSMCVQNLQNIMMMSLKICKKDE